MTRWVKFGSRVALGLTLMTVFAANALAQECTKPNLVDFGSCVADGIADCSETTPQCESLSYVLTLDDIEEIARDRCCDLNKKSRRRACLVKERNRFKPRLAGAPQNNFFKGANKRINQLRAADCGSLSAYDQLF